MARPKRGEETRARIYEAALRLFREQGFDETTMRDIARVAGTSLGSANYHFGSKENLVLHYYAGVVAEREAEVSRQLVGVDDLAERIRISLLTHHEVVGGDRRLLGALVRTVADPDSPVSVFASETAQIRERALGLFEQVLDVPEVPAHVRDLAVLGLWVLDLAILLYFVWDDSPEQAATRQLVDDAIAAIMPVVPLLATPFAEPFLAHLAGTLIRAGLVPEEGVDGANNSGQ
ncbi:MAG: TetR/AcrR family transcriptional regulator [Myxococcota bacterium]